MRSVVLIGIRLHKRGCSAGGSFISFSWIFFLIACCEEKKTVQLRVVLWRRGRFLKDFVINGII